MKAVRCTLLLAILFCTQIFAQGIPFRMGARMYFIDANGDTLGVFDGTSNIIEWRTGAIRHINESATQIDLSFDGDDGVLGDEGIIRHMRALQQLRFFTNGTEAARIDSFQNVGIGGGFAPSALLHVRGVANTSLAKFTPTTGSGYVLISSDAQGDPIFSMLDATGAEKNKFFSDATSSYISGKLGIGTDAPSQKLEVNGYVERHDVTDWDAIAWFPPSDSGAVLDTLDNVIEVLGFYHNTDSVYAVNTWQAPPYFTAIDSIWVTVEAPNTSGDSAAYALAKRQPAEGEAANGSFAIIDTVIRDLGTTSRALRTFRFTSGFSGIAANDIVDFKLWRVNSGVSNNVAAVVNLRRTRIFWR